MIVAFYTQAFLLHMTSFQAMNKDKLSLSQRERSKTVVSQPVFRCPNRISKLLNTVEFSDLCTQGNFIDQVEANFITF